MTKPLKTRLPLAHQGHKTLQNCYNTLMNQKTVTFFWAVLPPVIWAGLIFFLSSQSTLPSLEQSIFDYILKHVAHVVVFGVLFFLVQRAQHVLHPATKSSTNWRVILIPLTITMTYALLDEVHQSFVPNRHPSLMDLGFDLIGAGTVLVWTNPQLELLHQLKQLLPVWPSKPAN